MPKVVSVRIHGRGTQTNYLTGDERFKRGDFCLVPFEDGLAMARVLAEPMELPEEVLSKNIKTVERRANERDLDQHERNVDREVEAFYIALDKIKEHGLEMHLVDVELLWNHSRIIFYFTADGRVDFRSLVKDLASIFRMRIDLRQIGVRDEAKMIGGLGICGRQLCCTAFLSHFEPVSIKMAKLQNLSMKPSKISGACGRLLCCLKYEEDAYRDLRKRLPRKGERVGTPEGDAVIEKLEILKERVVVRLLDNDDADPLTFHFSELTKLRKSNKGNKGGKGGKGGRGKKQKG